MGEWWRKLRGRLRLNAIDDELREEMLTHIEMKASASGDLDAARRQFGNLTFLQEESRAIWGWPRVEAWLRDLRYALRGLARNPGFSAAVVATLALGIGASSTIYSLMDTVLIRPLPYPDSERLVAVHEAKSDEPRNQTPVAPGRLEDWQSRTRAFEAIAGSHQDPLIDATGAVPERLLGAFVSPRFFSVLGVPPAMGRVFTPLEEEFGGPRAIVISDAFWRRRFAADPTALGRTLRLSDRTYTIVGVMPAVFQYPTPSVEVWVPKQAGPDLLRLREARFYHGVARLKPGVTPEQARSDIVSIQTRLGREYPKTDAGWGVVVTPLKEELVGQVRLALWFLLGSVSLLLLIACSNVACLLLARLNSRSVEIATRCALGAGRAAIARQFFIEALVYALLGGLLGVAAVLAAMDFLRKRLPDIPRVAELALDGTVLAVVIGISFVAAVLFSLGPILHTLRADLTASLIRGGRGLVGTRQRLPRVLVAAQLALATTLLTGAGLFLRSMIRTQEVPLGFEPERVLTLRVTATYGELPQATVQRHQRTLEGLAAIPGVDAVAMSSGLPAVNPAWPREFEIAGEATTGGALRFAAWRIVTAGYFETLGIPILTGATCRMNSDPRQPFEVLVNRSFAARYFAGRDPIGRTIVGGPMGDTSARITGVVADAREDGRTMEPQPLIYACGFLRYWPDSDYLIRTRDPASLANAVRVAVGDIEPSRPAHLVRPLDDALYLTLSQTRFRTLLISLFSLLALVLAAVGLYGVTAYMVSQRRREIGIRIALGARPRQVLGEILRSAGVLAACGAAAGIVLAAAASRLLGTLLYGVRPFDVTAYLAATAVLFAVALLACLVPGKRATSIDPTEALRTE